jgi:hypothetical protein
MSQAHKIEQAWVKQKNGAIVRRIVGYRRFEELDLNQYGRVIGRV